MSKGNEDELRLIAKSKAKAKRGCEQKLIVCKPVTEGGSSRRFVTPERQTKTGRFALRSILFLLSRPERDSTVKSITRAATLFASDPDYFLWRLFSISNWSILTFELLEKKEEEEQE